MYDDRRILNLLADRGPMQHCAIADAMLAHMSWRRVDASLRRLQRDGRVHLLPRESGVRPFALWAHSHADEGHSANEPLLSKETASG